MAAQARHDRPAAAQALSRCGAWPISNDRCSTLVGPGHDHVVSVPRASTQPGLCRRQQLGKRGEVAATSRGQPERRTDIDLDHMHARCEPHLALAGEQDVPGFMLLPADRGMLAVGAEPPVCSTLAPGTGEAVTNTAIEGVNYEADLDQIEYHLERDAKIRGLLRPGPANRGNVARW